MKIIPFSSLPTDAIIYRQARAAYAAEPPYVHNLEDLDPSWTAKNKRIWAQATKQPPEAVVARLKGAIVCGRGAVFWNDGVLEGTVAHNTPPQHLPLIKRTISETTVLLRGPGDANFGHWLAELGPRIFDFQRAVGNLQVKFVVAANPLALRHMRQRSLEACGVAQSQILWLDADPVLFDDLIVMGPNSIHSHIHDADNVKRFIEANKPEALSVVASDSRLYIKRPSDLKRALLNEPEVESFFVQRGFQTISPETLTFEQQIETFSAAQIVVGVSGAALTNIMWSKPGCKVLSMAPNVGAEHFFWDLANIVGHHFGVVFGRSLAPELVNHGSFEIDKQQLSLACEKHLGI